MQPSKGKHSFSPVNGVRRLTLWGCQGMCLQTYFLFLSSCVCGFMVWVWELSPRAECDLSGHLPPWPFCLFLAFSVSLLKSQHDLRWCQTDFSLEGHCDSSLYLTGLCHVRSMTVVVFVWNLIRDFASAIWRPCSFCSFYCFWLRVALRGRK